jgi:nitroreductase
MTMLPAVHQPSEAPRPGKAVLAKHDVEAAIAMAARAPSLHNTQPWKFRVQGDVIELLADSQRQLCHLDPAGRELTISCGAALFGLRLGLRRRGYMPVVDLLPDMARPELLARVRPDGRAALTAEEAELVAALPHRHTHRGPFTPGEVPARLLMALQLDAAAERSDLILVQNRAQLAGLAMLTELAAAQQRADAEIAAELSRWVRQAGSTARDGVPAAARTFQQAAGAESGPVPGHPGPPASAGEPALLRIPPRDFGQPGTEPVDGAPPAATAVLTTPGDTAADWLRAGQALQRLLLRAATRWVFASLQSQPLESPARRGEVRDLLGLAGQPQMLLQLGRANTALATPRRPHSELRANEEEA